MILYAGINLISDWFWKENSSRPKKQVQLLIKCKWNAQPRFKWVRWGQAFPNLMKNKLALLLLIVQLRSSLVKCFRLVTQVIKCLSSSGVSIFNLLTSFNSVIKGQRIKITDKSFMSKSWCSLFSCFSVLMGEGAKRKFTSLKLWSKTHSKKNHKCDVGIFDLALCLQNSCTSHFRIGLYEPSRYFRIKYPP